MSNLRYTFGDFYMSRQQYSGSKKFQIALEAIKARLSHFDF
ncbi:hypothetical protein [Piscirickettsia salmonis]|nr:hypothetical protein [Piscirickettsia salmonis]